MKQKVQKAQEYLRKMDVEGWLIYNFHDINPFASLFLHLAKGKASRRLFYWIPREGAPIQLLHAVESELLREWPGETRLYLSWESLQKELQTLLQGKKKIAMEFSPRGEIPYISKIDGGTIDLVRSFGVEVVSSGEFLAYFTAILSPSQAKSHKRAALLLQDIIKETWEWLSIQLKKGKTITEYDFQQKIVEAFSREKLVTGGPPIVAVGAHSADPHYTPTREKTAKIQKGDFLLTDLWAKEDSRDGVFGDITKVAVVGREPTPKELEVFQVVFQAQKAGIDLIKQRFSQKKRVEGLEVDQAVRKVIVDKGYGPFFLHRTGHNIKDELHGSGANIDSFETNDFRPLLCETTFSIEPGIYLKGKFGVRLETDLYVTKEGSVEITGGLQDALFVVIC